MDLNRSKSSNRLSQSSSLSSLYTMSSLRQRAADRLGRKSRPSSIVSSSSSLSSTAQSSCVNRDTANDDCDMHRFIVWAAVRRNLSGRISDDERRQCPLLECKQKFQDHERMLQHLYRCKHLTSGRYWCHECDRDERFTDAKRRRCLNGNPSMRRKIMSRAKVFWQSLGNKSNGATVDSFTLDDAMLGFGFVMEEPPSGKAELPSETNEIFEIDSHEVWNNPHAMSMDPQATFIPSGPPPTSVPHTDHRLSLFQWEAQNSRHFQPPVPEQAYHLAQGAPPFDPGQTQQNARLNKASVRSTASAASTASNISNFSTWSNVSGVSSVSTSTNISTVPILAPADAVWYESTWNQTAKVDATMPVAANPLMSRPYNDKPEIAFADASPHALSELPTISELPAEPVADCSPAEPAIPTDFAQLLGLPLVPLPSPPEPVAGPPAHTDSANVPCNADADGMEAVPHAVDSVLEPVWDVLRDHVSCSLESLRNLPSNYLAVQFTQLTPESIIAAGFATAKNMLQYHAQVMTEPLDMICFAHVVFALGFALDDRYTKARASDMYHQTLFYGMLFAPDVREAYQEICSSIWEPTGINSAAASLMPALPLSATSSYKGKEASRSSFAMDPLASMAQFFLDKLEGAVLEDSSVSSICPKPSLLATRHSEESATFVGGDMTPALARVKHVLLDAYANHPTFSANIERVILSNSTGTIRRTELELLQLGRTHLPWRTFFEAYVPLIREQCDVLYAQLAAGTSSRLSYHIQGLALAVSDFAEFDSALQSYEFRRQSWTAARSTPDFDADLDFMVGLDSKWDNIVNNNGGAEGLTLDTSNLLAQDETMVSELSEDEWDSPLSGSLPTNLFSTPQQASGPPTPPTAGATPGQTSEAEAGCDLCPYRPKGDPRWYKGSMAKHMKNQHGDEVKMFRCPYPGCGSVYKNRLDNLKAHQADKNHYVEDEASPERPAKRRRVEEE